MNGIFLTVLNMSIAGPKFDRDLYSNYNKSYYLKENR